MKAVVVRSFGGPEALEIADVPVPEPEAGQVRIRVEAAPVNPVDIATRAGWLVESGLMRADGQIGIGWDLAGEVETVGAGVEKFRPGDNVIGIRDLLNAPIGAQAEQIVLDEDAIAHAPRTVSAAEASTLPLNGLTAAQGLDLLALERGQWLLVTGAAGALGGFVLEMAALRGLQTVAVAATYDEEIVRQLGADKFVPRTERLGPAVRHLVPGGVDGAFDAALVGLSALDAVRDGGAFLAVSAGAAPLPLRGIRVQNQWIHQDGARLSELVALLDGGRLTARVASTHPLGEVSAAHERIARGGVRGRIVLQPAA